MRKPASKRVAPESETVVLAFDAPLPAGSATLDVQWTGHFSDGLRGLYAAGKVAATQFEAADARRALPLLRRAGLQGALGAHGARAPRA